MTGETETKRPHQGKSARERLDTLVVERGLAPSRERARALIMAGDVRVDGVPALGERAYPPACQP